MDVSSPLFSCSSLSSDSELYNVSSPESSSSGRPKPRRTRCKNPSKQRRNASEKEKLRMRDLTKALHYLRTFLPPFVAPAGQTLTKIETLRLAIRYISYLSSQLHLQMSRDLASPQHATTAYSQEAENPGNEEEVFHFQKNESSHGAFYQCWTSGNGKPQEEDEHVTPPHSGITSEHRLYQHQTQSKCIRSEMEQRRGTKMEIANCDEVISSGFESLMCPHTSLWHQDYRKGVQGETTGRDVWI